jgi:hypothetical protein
MAAKKRKLLVARQTVTVKHGKSEYPLWAGVTRVPVSHPLAKQYPELFEPVAEPQQPADPEQANRSLSHLVNPTAPNVRGRR